MSPEAVAIVGVGVALAVLVRPWCGSLARDADPEKRQRAEAALVSLDAS